MAEQVALKEVNFDAVDISKVFEEFDTGDLSDLLTDVSGFNELMLAIAYQGFRPDLLNRALQCRAAESGRNFREDIVFLIAILASRGSNISKMLTRMNPKGRQIISTLKNAYCIENRAKISSTYKEIITLPRIASTYPMIGMAIFASKSNLDSPVGLIKMNSLSNLYPRLLMSPGFASIIPNESHSNPLAKATLLYMIELSKLIGPKSNTVEDVIRQSVNIMDIARRGDFISTDIKLKHLLFHKLIEQTSKGKIPYNGKNYKYSSSVNAAAVVFENKYPDVVILGSNEDGDDV